MRIAPAPITPELDLPVHLKGPTSPTRSRFVGWLPTACLLLLLAAPSVAIFVPVWFIEMQDPAPSMDSSQVPWVVIYICLSLPIFVIRPLSNVNLFHDVDAFLFRDLRRGIACWLFYILVNTVPYFFDRNPVPFLMFSAGPIMASVVNVLQSKAYAKAVNPYNDDPEANGRAFSRASSVVNTSCSITLFFLTAFVQIPRDDTFLQALAGVVLGTVTLAQRLCVPWYVSERMSLRRGRSIKPLIAFAIECASECWLQLAFPHIDSMVTFAMIAIVEALSTVASSLWMLVPFQVWVMSAVHPASSPHSNWSVLQRLRSSLSGMIVPSDVAISRLHSIGDDWMDNARTHLFMRQWAQLNGTLMFITMITLATYSPNSRFFPFRASDAQHYHQLVGFSLLTVLVQMATLNAMAWLSAVLQNDAKYWQMVDCLSHGRRWLLSSKRNMLYTVSLPLVIGATAVGIFTKQAASVYMLFDHDDAS
ncbi:Uncharacterized protein PBTT_00082 [Plasmodiophora brassicae]